MEAGAGAAVKLRGPQLMATIDSVVDQAGDLGGYGAVALRAGSATRFHLQRSPSSVAEIHVALDRARQEARRMYLQFRCPALAVGAGLVLSSMLLPAGWGTPQQALVNFAAGLMRSLGGCIFMLAILPSDRRSPQVGSAALIAIAMWRCADSSVMLVNCIGPEHHRTCLFTQDSPPPDKFDWACQVRALVLAATVLITGCISLYLAIGFCLPPRSHLENLWQAACWSHVAMGMLCLLKTGALELSEWYGLRITGDWAVVTAVQVSYWFAMAAMLRRPALRRRVQFWLRSRGGELTAASSIAAFIGGHRPEAILAKAAATCRCVSLEKVTKEDMETPAPDARLQRHTGKCRLEDIDAFVSHSWCDPPEMKWAALQRWRREFKAQNRREPKVWIDKYCLDQTDIRASLMCLPIFLAGCQQLLILAGPTYLSRLWCMEEVFIYLQMGRDVESMEVLATSAEVPDQILKFDVADARCKLRADRDILLATIEAGCSSFEIFNSLVRTALHKAALSCAV